MDIEDVLTAFRDWAEADAELKQALGEYTFIRGMKLRGRRGRRLALR